MSDIFDAIDRSDAGTVWSLTRKGGAALTAIDEATGLTPLGLAVESGLSEIVRTLLEAGANPDNGGSTTPLDLAVASRDHDLVEILLQAGADIERELEGGHTPLMTAAATGDVMLIKRLLRAGARPRRTNDEGETPMAIARAMGFEAAGEVLRIAAGWRRKGQSRTGPVRMIKTEAAASKAEAAARKTESPKETKTEKPTSPEQAPEPDRELAVKPATNEAPRPTDSKALVEQVERLAALLAEGDDDAIGQLFRSGTVDVERQNEHGFTALMVAAALGHRAVAQLLIDYGAEPDAQDKMGRGALIHATRGSSDERDSVIEHLFRCGATLEQPCQEFRTPLMHAIECDLLDPQRAKVRGFGNTTRTLLRLGADPHYDLGEGSAAGLLERDLATAPFGSPIAHRIEQLLDLLDETTKLRP